MSTEAKKVILIVDDEQHLREIISFDLRDFGHSILEAPNGKTALEISRLKQVDLVISDVRMPVASGIDLLKALRAINPAHPPFVFMTAFSDISSDEALDLGAEGFLRKPFDKLELVEAIERALVPMADRWKRDPGQFRGISSLDFTSSQNDWILPEAMPHHVEIGQGGMFVAQNVNFPASFEVVHFKVAPFDDNCDTIEGYGQVRWVRQQANEGEMTGLGIEFLHFDESNSSKVANYLQARRPNSFIPFGRLNSEKVAFEI